METVRHMSPGRILSIVLLLSLQLIPVAAAASSSEVRASGSEARTSGSEARTSGIDRPSSFRIECPNLLLENVHFTIRITALQAGGAVHERFDGEAQLAGIRLGTDGSPVAGIGSGIGIRFSDGRFEHNDAYVDETGGIQISVSTGDIESTETVNAIPGILSILPPLLAIVLALLLRQVIISLFAGVWLGAVFVFGYDPFGGFLRVLDHYIINALADPDHISIIAFSMLFGGMVGVITKSGGTAGIADVMIRMARSPRRGQFATWLLGFLIFFDDYANSLIVGNTMRPITDRLKISREKLSFLVDSTAAPVSSLLFISTWIGYEVGLIDSALKTAGYSVESAYAVFLEALPYSFYPILALFFGALISLTDRDFGPMSVAERRARTEGKLSRDGAQLATDLTDSASVLPAEGVVPRWWNAAIPVATVVVIAIAGMIYTGLGSIDEAGSTDYSIGNIIGNSDSYRALLWASLLSCVVAIALAVSQRLLSVTKAMDAWFNGLKSMLLAMLILTLAWSIGSITAELHTADYLVQILEGNLSPYLLPVLTFVIAAVISFATGTSWGTMGITMPIVIPLAIVLAQSSGMDPEQVHVILLGTVSSVLAGAVFGDHCSPISDTTILSSMASSCDHIDHVRTQLPYAMIVAIAGILFGSIPMAFGFSPLLSNLLAAAALTLMLFKAGRKNPGLKV